MKPKVLIVDDEPLIRRALERAFMAFDFDVKVAENGREGLKFWKEWKPQLVLLDMIMPEMNGFEVLKSKPQVADVKVQAKLVLISAYSGDAKLSSPKEYGADLFIAKPFDDIFDVVKRCQNLL